MSKKTLITVAVLPVLVIIAALLYTFWQDFQGKQNKLTSADRTYLDLPISYSTLTPDWTLKSTLPQNLNVSSPPLGAHQAFKDMLENWGFWSYNGVKGVSKITSQTQNAPLAIAAISVKRVEVKLVPKPQPLFINLNDKSLLILSLGDEYTLENQTLTIFINIPTSFLENNPVANPRDITPAANNIFIARLYQLTHPETNEEDARNFAAYIYQNTLSGLNLFEIIKINGN